MNGPRRLVTREERRALQHHLQVNRECIIAAWTQTQFDQARLTRWQVAGVNGQDRAYFERAFVGPLFDLLTGWLVTWESRW